MWWLRRPARPAPVPVPTDPPGGTRRPDFGAIALVGAVAIAVGIFLPVFGVSLLLFLLVDAVRAQRTPAGAG
jgi:uncharacterized iron-regulated membrane protein